MISVLINLTCHRYIECKRVNQWGGGDRAGGAILMGTFDAPTDTFMFITFESQLVALLCWCQWLFPIVRSSYLSS